MKTTQRIQPFLHQNTPEIQAFDSVIEDLPIGLSVEVRKEVVGLLNRLLADTITMRDLYKKSHWQVSGPTFYQLHLVYDKHSQEQSELIDELAERIQFLGGISVAMAADVVKMTSIPHQASGREEVPVQLSRLLEAHEIVIKEARSGARKISDCGDEGSNDLIISSVLRKNEAQVWFLYEHLVNMPLVIADSSRDLQDEDIMNEDAPMDINGEE